VGADAADLTPHGFLQLVADPQRWQLLRELARSDRRVNELTALLGKPQNVVSYHLGELRAAGLVSAKPSAADRRDSYYRAELRRCGELLGAA
jgi:DNA-binding transcriptional ArsR family regulator